MSGLNKVDMSLDDIIKLSRKQKKRATAVVSVKKGVSPLKRKAQQAVNVAKRTLAGGTKKKNNQVRQTNKTMNKLNERTAVNNKQRQQRQAVVNSYRGLQMKAKKNSKVKLNRNRPVQPTQRSQPKRKWDKVNRQQNNVNSGLMQVSVVNKPSKDTRVFVNATAPVKQQQKQQQPQQRRQIKQKNVGVVWRQQNRRNNNNNVQNTDSVNKKQKRRQGNAQYFIQQPAQRQQVQNKTRKTQPSRKQNFVHQSAGYMALNTRVGGKGNQNRQGNAGRKNTNKMASSSQRQVFM